jgi:hypothetical protein
VSEGGYEPPKPKRKREDKKMSATTMMLPAYVTDEVKEVKVAAVDHEAYVNARVDVFDGTVLFVIGLVLAAITYTLAHETPGGIFLTLFVSFGGMVCGPVQIISGLLKLGIL